MATATCAANTAAQSLFTVDKVHIGKVTGITVDNQSGALRTIQFKDVFTPDPSVGTTSPTQQTIVRKQISVGTLLTATLEGDDLKDVDIIGNLQAVADAISAACVITVSYHEE